MQAVLLLVVGLALGWQVVMALQRVVSRRSWSALWLGQHSSRPPETSDPVADGATVYVNFYLLTSTCVLYLK